MRGRASSSRRQRGGAAVVPNRSGLPTSGSGRSSNNINNNGSSSSSGSGLFHSHSSAQSATKSDGGKPKWLPSWRKLRRCLLQPYSLELPPSLDPSSDPSVPTRSPSCGSDGDHSAHDDDDEQTTHNPNNILSSPLSLASSSSSSSLSAPPPPPPPPPMEDCRFKNLAHPLAEEEEVGSHQSSDRDVALRDSAERMEPQRADSRMQAEESLEPEAIKFDENQVSSTAVESVPEAASAAEAIGGSSTSLPRTAFDTTAAAAAAKPGPVRRTFTEAPARARLSASVPTPTTPSSVVAPDLKLESHPVRTAARDSTDASDGPAPRAAAAAAPRPTVVRRGCSVPVMGAAPATATKQPLSPTSARLSLLPPKAPLTSSSGGGAAAAANRPSIVARRISSTATGGGAGGPMRQRLGSSGGESNLTSSSRHRRSNNSFEFSVDSLQMIRDADANEDPNYSSNVNNNNARNMGDPRGRQVSENSWSTMPVASIQIGSLERDCSEMVSDDFWEVDSLIMSSDGEDDEDGEAIGETIPEGGDRPFNGYDTAEDDDDNDDEEESDVDKDNGVSPSPTSIMDDVESRGKQAQDGAGLPDWMLQWAQQPTPHGQDNDAEGAASVPPLAEEPTYLPGGPKPEGCALSTYVGVSMGESHDDSTRDDGRVRLVQVIAGKLVVEGKWELELNRDTRIQPICVEDDPHRVVLVRQGDQEWRLNPVPVIATRDGGFRRALIKSRRGGGAAAAVVSSEGWDDATHFEADWSVGPSPDIDDDSQQCEATLHLVFLLDSICRRSQV
jgi:hypothetical protein